MRGRFYCSYYEGEHRKRHLEESRVGRESSQLNVASRLDVAMRGERGGKVRGRQKKMLAKATKRGAREREEKEQKS